MDVAIHQLKHHDAEIAHARRPDPETSDPGLWLRCDDGSISALSGQCPGADWRGRMQEATRTCVGIRPAKDGVLTDSYGASIPRRVRTRRIVL